MRVANPALLSTAVQTWATPLVLVSVALLREAAAHSAMVSHTVDLDLPPEQRWRNISLEHKDDLIKDMISWNRALSEAEHRNDISAWLASHQFKEEHLKELRGIVDAVDDPSVTVQGLILNNLIYELAFPRMCTGILAAMPNGNVVQGRTLDYYTDPEYNFSKARFIVTLQRAGKPIITHISKPGLIGVHTGMRIGGWSVQQNSKKHNIFVDNLRAAKQGAHGYMLELRQILEDEPTYDGAVERLRFTQFMAPSYFVVAGAGWYEGAIIGVNRFEEGTRWMDGEYKKLYNQEGHHRWWLLQTNDDLKRYQWSSAEIVEMGQERVSLDSVEGMMTRAPIFNKLTIFTWIAVPATGEWRLVTRDEVERRYANSTSGRATLSRRSGELRGRASLELEPSPGSPLLGAVSY